MKVAYVTTFDAQDIQQWSGLGTYMARTLELAGCELTYVNVRETPTAARAFGRAITGIRGRRYLPEREPLLAHLRARRIMRAGAESADVIFSPGTLSVALLETSTPTVVWTDATFGSMADFYPGFSRLDARTIRNGFALEGQALRRVSAAIYASEWAAASAIADHGASPERVHVLPFGANLDDPPSEADALAAIAARTRDVWRLIFIGVDWTRKGGDIAVNATRLLNEQGIPAELTVIGRAPRDLPPFVQNLGYLDKRVDAQRFRHHLERSHFLVLPSRAECAGVVFSEASAYGVPSFGSDVGGVATQLRDGANGYLLNANAGPEAYAEAIAKATARYDELAHSALREYHARLSWSCSARALEPLLRQLVSREDQTPTERRAYAPSVRKNTNP
jgi:glycosyltransferase involved in cell wall biosynthesis